MTALEETDVDVERLLISACLAPERDLELAFRELDSDASLDGLNEGTMRLIPFLYRRLLRAGITSPRLPILKGVYTRYWYLENMYRARGVVQCASILEDLPFLVVKGQALQRLVYQNDLATRPADDMDILLRVDQREEALDRFLENGFRPKQARWKKDLLAMHPSVGLTRSGVDIDLHWDLKPPVETVNTAEIFFRDSRTIKFGEFDLQTSSINHHLAHTLVHGAARNEVSPIRWVLDASQLLLHPDFLASKFWWDTQELGWENLVEEQIGILRDTYRISIPNLGNKKITVPVAMRQRLVQSAHKARGAGFKRTLASLLVTRPEQYRSIRTTEGASSGFSLLIVVALTAIGELYRKIWYPIFFRHPRFATPADS